MIKGPVSDRRYSRRAIRKAIFIASGVVLALIIVVGGGYLYNTFQESARQSALQELEATTKGIAQTVAAPFTEIQGQLAAIASDPQVIRLFEQGDSDVLDARSSDYESRFASVLRLRMLLPGEYTQDNSATSPLTFASLDMLNRASSGGRVVAEVHLFGSDNQLIAIVERVVNAEDELIGLLHLSLSTDLFEQSVANVTTTDFYIEVQQGLAKQLVLAKKGEPSLRQGDPVSTIIPMTNWRVSYWQEGVSIGEEGTGGLGLVPIIAVSLLILGGIGFVLSKRSANTDTVDDSKTADDDIVYAGAIQAIMDGAHPGLEEHIPNLPKGNAPRKANPLPASQGASGDDITTMASVKDVNNAVAIAEDTTVPQDDQPDLSDAEPVFDISAEPPTADSDSGVATTEQAAPSQSTSLSRGIFRTYDIRGIVGEELNADTVFKIGQSIGSEALTRGEQGIIVGRDGRTSSQELGDALIAGLRASGRDVIDIGLVPTPVLYFATHTLESKSGVMLTGSHNGPEYNGLKIVLGGDTLSEDAIASIYNRIVNNELETGEGTLQTQEISADYIRRISEDIPVALGGAFKIVVDCGNGVPGVIAPHLYRSLGHDVVELYCEVDGNFPNHHPDPSQPANMQMLIDKVKEEKADLGFAFDGDGDRLGLVDAEGNIIWPDRQMMLLARDVLSRNQGAEIIFDVKCSRFLRAIIESSGGKPLMWKTGHSLIKSKMKETGSPLAGEMSGHIFFKERWYGFDDALYTGARIIEVLMNAKANPVDIFAELPEGIATPELRVDLAEDSHQEFMLQLKDKLSFDDATVYDIDGFRVEFTDGWGLVRPSNTTPCLVLRFEADSQEALDRIQGEFKTLMLSINPDLVISF